MIDNEAPEVFRRLAAWPGVFRSRGSTGDFRQANARRRIRQRKPKESGTNQGNNRGHEKAKSPIESHQITAKNYDQTAANRMRHVPKRKLGREFLWRKPVGH